MLNKLVQKYRNWAGKSEYTSIGRVQMRLAICSLIVIEIALIRNSGNSFIIAKVVFLICLILSTLLQVTKYLCKCADRYVEDRQLDFWIIIVHLYAIVAFYSLV